MAGIDSAEGSHGHEVITKLEIRIDNGLSSYSKKIQDKFESLKDTKIPAQNSKPLIQKVPFLLRDHNNFKKYYEPRAIALGPFHHGKPELELAEKYKIKCAAQFIEYSGQTAETLYDKIKSKIQKFKECFDLDDETTKKYDDEDLSWMLFIDGCSTLEYIRCVANDEWKKMQIKNDQVAISQQDLFLLENQLPFELLDLLMESSTMQTTFRSSIKKFIGMNVIGSQEEEQQKQPGQQQQRGVMEEKPAREVTEEKPAHLLGLLRLKLLGTCPKSSKKVKENIWQSFCKFLGTWLKSSKNAKGNNWQSFRNVEELKAAGIQLSPSKTSDLTDISFNSKCFTGHLNLPPITVDDSTAPKLLNLVAYEMCPDFANEFEVSSYVCFLDSLIDEPNDVKSLRSARILNNFLGSDEEVANLFNEISTDLVPNPDAYKDVKADIEKHYNNIYMVWMAQVCHEHFSSPWTILAFGAAIVALFLTGVQSWFSVFSSSPCDSVCSHLSKTLNMK